MRKMPIVFVLLCLLAADGAQAQDAACDCYIGSIASFDFEMKLPDPAGNTVAVQHWNALAAAPRNFSVWAFENPGCANYRKIDAASLVASWGDGTLRSGNSSNVAPPGPVKPLEYLFSGEISGDGASYTITVRLETGYSRETIRAGSVTSSLDSDGPLTTLPGRTLAQTLTAVRALAQQFQPVGSTILEYERNKRASQPAVARTTKGGTLDVKPEKQKMVEGETIRVDVTLTDCDGVPLGNREVRFSSGEWPDLGTMPGTTNGTVSPDPVTTDGDGKATVNLTAKEKGTLMLRAWYGHFRPSGHPNALYKEIPISVNQPPQYYISVEMSHSILENQEYIQYTSDNLVFDEQILHNTDTWNGFFTFFYRAVPAIVQKGALRAGPTDGDFQYSQFTRRANYEPPGELSTAYVEKTVLTACPASEELKASPDFRCFEWLFNAWLGTPLAPGVPAFEMPKQIVISIPIVVSGERRAMRFSKSGGWQSENPVILPNTIKAAGSVLKAGSPGVTWEEKDGKITVKYKSSKVTEKPEIKYKKEELDEVTVEIIQI